MNEAAVVTNEPKRITHPGILMFTPFVLGVIAAIFQSIGKAGTTAYAISIVFILAGAVWATVGVIILLLKKNRVAVHMSLIATILFALAFSTYMEIP